MQLRKILAEMFQEAKAMFLIQNGWKEVPSDGGGTCWQAPIAFLQRPLYFALDAAYELETVGEGIHAYAGKLALAEALWAEDLRRMNENEAKYFSETGQFHGIYPNY